MQSGSAGNGAGWLVHTLVLTSNEVTHYKNTELIETFSAQFNTPSSGGVMRLGLEINDNSKVAMSVAALAGWNRALQPSELTQVQSYWAQRFGL